MSIEQTKAKNNNAMIRKIQRKLDTRQFHKNKKEALAQDYLLS